MRSISAAVSKTRAIGAAVSTTIDDIEPELGAGAQQILAQIRIVGVAEIDVPHSIIAAIAKSMLTARTVIDQLPWHRQATRRHVGTNAADRVDRDHAPDPGLMQCPEIGSIIDHVRRHTVTGAMSRQEYQLDILPVTEQWIRGCFTIRRIARQLLGQAKLVTQ